MVQQKVSPTGLGRAKLIVLFFPRLVAATAAVKSLQSCPTVQPHGLQPTRLRPWDFPGKSTGVGRQCLLHLDWLPVFVKA